MSEPKNRKGGYSQVSGVSTVLKERELNDSRSWKGCGRSCGRRAESGRQYSHEYGGSGWCRRANLSRKRRQRSSDSSQVWRGTPTDAREVRAKSREAKGNQEDSWKR